MKRFELRPGLRRLFRLPLRTPAAIHADIDEELDALLQARVDALIAHGMSTAEARAETLRRLGTSVDAVRDQLHQSAEIRERRMRLHEHFENLAQDIGYAARGLARRPAFTAVAVLTLAIGIGATTAIFSAVNVLLLRPLPYASPDQLMKVSLVVPGNGPRRKGGNDMVWSYPKFLVFRDAQQIFQRLSLYTQTQFTITSGDVELIPGEFVGATYLRTLGLSPARGRDFEPSVDAHPDAERQAIISDALWQRRYNADPTIVGKTIDLDRSPYTIVGVAAADFSGLTGQAQIFVPITTRHAKDDLDQRQSHEFFLVARRKPAVSVSQAAAVTELLGKRVNEAIPDTFIKTGVWGANAQPLDNARIAPLVKRSLFVLFGAVGCVLLIACVNLANLLLGRASARRREIAVRLAIGASRARLVRLLLTESSLVAALGGTASIAVAWLGMRALSTLNPVTTLRARGASGLGAVGFSAIHLDWTALAFTFAVAMVVGLVFGLAPALEATRASLSNAMKDGSDDTHSRAPAGRRVLVVTEVALAMVLLAGSGLMIRSLAKLLAIDPGFDARNVLTTRLTIPSGGLGRDSMPGFYEQLLERVRSLPGVTDASLSNCPPLNGGCASTKIEFLDRPKVELSQMPNVGIHWASPTWFSTLRIPLRRGRLFTTADRLGAAKVVVVNETAARTFWPNENPIGKRVGLGQGGFHDAEVIGIVGDVRQVADSLPKPDVYIPYYQSPRAGMMIYVRTAGNPAALATDVRRAIHEVAPQYPMYDMQPLTARVADATAQARFSAVLLGLFAATALCLAVIGIYGVMSLAVAARTRELGIRIALGADQRRVQRLVVGEGLALVSVGAALGLAGALLSTRVLQTMLFDLTPSDPVTYTVVVVLLAAAALAASWIPARRASRVDPSVALRAE